MSADLEPRDASVTVHRIWHLALAAAAATALAALLLDPGRAGDERTTAQLEILRVGLWVGAAGLVGLWMLRRPLAADLAGSLARWRRAPEALAPTSLLPGFASPRVERLFAAGLVAWFVAIGVSHRAGASWLVSITFENGPAETVTVLAYLAATALAVAAAVRCLRDGTRVSLRPWILILLALGCFVIAAEETDWGQTYLKYASPEAFEHANIQQDVSLHNLALPDSVPGTRWANWMLRGLGWLGGGLLPLLLFASAPFRRWMWAWEVPIPPAWALAALFAAACMPEFQGEYLMGTRENVGSELREVTIGVAVAVWLWSAWRQDRAVPGAA